MPTLKVIKLDKPSADHSAIIVPEGKTWLIKSMFGSTYFTVNAGSGAIVTSFILFQDNNDEAPNYTGGLSNAYLVPFRNHSDVESHSENFGGLSDENEVRTGIVRTTLFYTINWVPRDHVYAASGSTISLLHIPATGYSLTPETDSSGIRISYLEYNNR